MISYTHDILARTVRLAPEAQSPAQLRWPWLLPGSWSGITSDSFSIPLWETRLEEGESLCETQCYETVRAGHTIVYWKYILLAV